MPIIGTFIMFGLFCDKNIAKIIKSLKIDYKHWKKTDNYERSLRNKMNKIVIECDSQFRVNGLQINDKSAEFLLTKYNKKYLNKAIVKWNKKLDAQKSNQFTIKNSLDNPEDFI